RRHRKERHMARALTLSGRLLCASNCAYLAAQNGPLPVPASDPFYDGAGFLQPPTAFVGGNNNVDAALVGTTADGVVLAFRGSLPLDQPGLDTLLDWFNDFNALLGEGAGLPGRVHTGFLESLDNLWNAVEPEVKGQLDAVGSDATVWITGHSKG